MNNKHLKKFLIISSVFMLILLPLVFAASYTLPQESIDINLLDDGTCMVTEEIIQDINGSINGTYRTFPLKDGQNIVNFSFETPGFNSKCNVTQEENNVTFKVWLYEDKEITKKINADRIKVIYHYNITNVVKIHNDTAELQYLTWGDMWDSDADNIKTSIHLPGSYDNVIYYYNPPTYLVKSDISNNTLVSEFKNVPANTKIEQRILIPKEYFKSYDNAVITNLNAKEKITSDEKIYQSYMNFIDTYDQLLNVFLLLFAIIPTLIIYLIFGLEPRVNYHKKYEYDIPEDVSPLFVNYMHKGDVGEFDIDAFSVTLLDLIDRGYYKVVYGDEHDTIIKKTQKDESSLKEYEKSIIDYFKKYEDDKHKISFKKISSNMKKNAIEYQNYLENWNQLAQKEIPPEREKKLFKKMGSSIFKVFSWFILILAVILLGLDHFNIFRIFKLYALILFMLMAIIFRLLPNTWAGRWTKEGRLSNLKWNAFKNYLTDYSMINEKPPESVQVWGKYIVYATALGCADTTIDMMRQYFDKIEVNDESIDSNNLISFAYYGGINSMARSLYHLNNYVESDNSSFSIGSIGGGSGGGGGGIF